jgi:hypothetical protein
MKAEIPKTVGRRCFKMCIAVAGISAAPLPYPPHPTYITNNVQQTSYWFSHVFGFQ